MMIPYEEKTIKLDPNERRPISHIGNVFTLFSASADVQISFGTESEFFPLTPGRSIPGPENGFKVVRFYNPNLAELTVSYAVSIREVRSFDALISATEALPVRGGGGSFTYDGATVVSNAAVLLLAADPTRTSAIIKAGAGPLWLGGAGVAAAGVATLEAGESVPVTHNDAVYGIRAAAGALEVGVLKEHA